MAIRGELHWHGLTISNAYVNVDNIRVIKKQFTETDSEGNSVLNKQLLVQYQYNIFTSEEDYGNSQGNAIQSVLNKRALIHISDDTGDVDIINACYVDLKTTVPQFKYFQNC